MYERGVVMYCGCNPTALSSQLQISRALTRLMLKKPFAAVSVSELSANQWIWLGASLAALVIGLAVAILYSRRR